MSEEELAQLRSELQTALLNFDGMKVTSLIEQGLEIAKTYVDPQKYHNALHELVLNYIAYTPQERPPKLHIKFIDILTVLTENGLDVNERDVKLYTALHHVVSSPDHPEIIKVLLTSGARVNQPDAGQQTPLHKAVLSGSKVDIETLLDGGADPNLMDNMGHSPIHVAVRRRNNGEILKLLTGCGGDVNLNHPEWSRSTQGFTPLHFAARMGRVENGIALLELGADPNKRDSVGQTPLHVAASNDITGVLCHQLLKHGADLHIADTLYGESALHKAVRASIEDNVRILLSKGANIGAVDSAGNSVLHCAATCCKDPTIWRLLVNARPLKAATTSFPPTTPDTLASIALNPNSDGKSALARAKNKVADSFLKSLN